MNTDHPKSQVLIVDDEQDIRELLSDFLEDEGYRCFMAKDAFEALKIFHRHPDVGLVMSDIRMPGRTGLELLGDLRKLDPTVMVIMISAVKDIESAISAMSRGAYDYVTKPFKLAEVALHAQRALENRRLIKEKIKYKEELEEKVAERTQELKGTLDKLNRTYSTTLRALVLALDTRDTETQGHSTRVVQYTLLLARIMEMNDQSELKILEYAALLHDIGKIGIPDAVLRKPGKLSPEEWKIMKTHPILGSNIIERIDFLKNSSKIVLHHHERYDGSGYPTGLSGKDIPLGSRIFTIADTIDAMTSERPYRSALSFEVAADELRKFQGVQFDPHIVDAFFQKPLQFWKDERKKIDRTTNYIDLYNLELS